MKLQFDANQQYQLDAIQAVVDLLSGQPREDTDFAVVEQAQGNQLFRSANHLLLPEETLRSNARTVQIRNDIEVPIPQADLDPNPVLLEGY